MTTKLTLTQQAYITTDATDESPYYTAHAVDSNNNDYQVRWTIISDSDEGDESNACNWDNPSTIYKDGHELDVKNYTITD